MRRLASACRARFIAPMRPPVCLRSLPIASAGVILSLLGHASGGMKAADAVVCRTISLKSSEGRHEAGDAKPFAEFLAGTKWLWYGREDRVLEFRKDGEFKLADWGQQNLAAVWKVTGPNEVTVTITSPKFKDLKARLVFNDDHSAFTGIDLGGKRIISRSPRVIATNPQPPRRRLVPDHGSVPYQPL